MESRMIRGNRNPAPTRGKTPSGIFSTNGKQKQDGATGPYMGVKAAAHSNSRSAPRSTGEQGLRHQSPKRK